MSQTAVVDEPIIDLQERTPPRRALVAMAAGPPRDAVVAVLARLGAAVVATADRGDPLLRILEERMDDLVVVELSRLGSAGLAGLVRTAGRLPTTGVVLLLPGGLGGPSSASLGIAAVLDESDVVGLRTVAADVLADARTQPG